MMSIKERIIIFLKGILMGICDLIPGISGGTIAFVTGIYSRLIESVKKITGRLFKKQKNLDIDFLMTLFLGILIAILIGSRIISFFLERYYVYTLAFFIGLILASSKIIFDKIESHNFKNICLGIIGFIAGISLSIIVPLEITPSPPYLLLAGFIAISAMFLPGISGAFILLIMGVYEFMLEALLNPFTYWQYLLLFIFGVIIGVFIISRVISFLFKKDQHKTLYFLLGLVLGALSIPIKKVIFSIIPNVYIMIFFFLLGILFFKLLNVYERA